MILVLVLLLGSVFLNGLSIGEQDSGFNVILEHDEHDGSVFAVTSRGGVVNSGGTDNTVIAYDDGILWSHDERP